MKASVANPWAFFRATLVVAFLGAFIALVAPSLIAQSGTLPANQMRVMGMATLQYADSNNGLLPLAYAPNGSSGLQRFASALPIPANWRTSDSSTRIAEQSVAWPNSLGTVINQFRVLETGGLREARIAGQDYVNINRPWIRNNLTYNGLLHAWPLNSITRMDRLPIIWQGLGNVNVAGFTFANPVLNCDGTGPCRFSPTAKPQANASATWQWLWYSSVLVDGNPITPSAMMRNHGLHVFTGDGSVIFWPIASDSSNVTNVRDPFSAYATNFVPQTMRACTAPGATVDYPCAFRPDAEFKP